MKEAALQNAVAEKLRLISLSRVMGEDREPAVRQVGQEVIVGLG